MPGTQQHLRGKVLRSPAQGVLALVLLNGLGHAEIRQTDIPMNIHENILGLEVPVGDVLIVEISHTENDTGGVEFRAVLLEAASELKMLEELASFHELHREEDLLRRLERVLEADKHRMLRLLQDLPLVLGMLDLFLVDDLVLAQRLKREVLLVVLLLHEHDLPEGSATENLQEVEVVDADL